MFSILACLASTILALLDRIHIWIIGYLNFFSIQIQLASQKCLDIHVSEYHISTSCKIYYKNLPEKLLNRVHTSVPRTDAEATTQRSLATTWCFRTLFSPARRPLGQDRTFQHRIWLLTNHICSK